jgi:hypothetical protein
MVVLFISAVVIGLFSQAFFNLPPKYKLQKAVREINATLNYARYKALFEGIKVRLRFNAHGMTLERFDKKEDRWTFDKESLIEGVTIQANNSPIFHPRGTVSNLASIYVSNSWGKYKMTLAITGRIKVVKR